MCYPIQGHKHRVQCSVQHSDVDEKMISIPNHNTTCRLRINVNEICNFGKAKTDLMIFSSLHIISITIIASICLNHLQVLDV